MIKLFNYLQDIVKYNTTVIYRSYFMQYYETVVPYLPKVKKFLEQLWNEVLFKGQFADRAIERLFRENRLSNNNMRGTIAIVFYDMVRNARLLQEIGEDNFDRIILSWRILRGMNHGIDKNIVVAISESIIEASKVRAIRLSVPDWLDAYGYNELGAAWEKIALSMLESPPISLRVNLRSCSRKQLFNELHHQGYEPQLTEHNQCGIVVNSSKSLFVKYAFLAGFYEMQDIASQEVGIFCNVQPGMRVIDACAGAGGKTLHLADIMQNRGKIIALDIRKSALQQLRERASRAHIDIIETRIIDSTKVVKRLEKKADVVLLDAPCSGSGVFRRNPDAKWRLKLQDIKEFCDKQSEILEHYSRMTALNGHLIYSVCSIFPAEGEKQIANFLSRHNDEFRLIAEQRLLTHTSNNDGFYMAKLQRLF